MNTLQLTFCDLRDDCITAIRNRFAKIATVKAEKNDIIRLRTDAWATAGNSFGDMSGGVDRAIDNHLSGRAQSFVQDAIRKEHFGELPVGSAIVVKPLPHKPALIYAPTMRVPGSIQGTANVYLAMRAILIAAIRGNFQTMACSTLGTGVGGVAPEDAADQMFQAYRLIVLGEFVNIVHSLQAPFVMRS